MSVTVACVLKSGGGYDPSWVYALKRAINRHLQDFEFRVLSDLDCFGSWGTRLEHNWRGWWSLVEWWRPGLFKGRVLAMGLDTLITGDLSELAAYDGPMAGISDFHQPKRLASGVMTWHADEGAVLYETFRRDPQGIMRRFPRMDPWMRTVIPGAARLQDRYPGQICSYKAHARKGPPENARIVCFHGRPAITDLPSSNWARALWSSI